MRTHATHCSDANSGADYFVRAMSAQLPFGPTSTCQPNRIRASVSSLSAVLDLGLMAARQCHSETVQPQDLARSFAMSLSRQTLLAVSVAVAFSSVASSASKAPSAT